MSAFKECDWKALKKPYRQMRHRLEGRTLTSGGGSSIQITLGIKGHNVLVLGSLSSSTWPRLLGTRSNHNRQSKEVSSERSSLQ